MKYYRPTWQEVDLGAIRHNFLQVRKLIDKATDILVAVKANAYGHGMIEVCRALADCGADYLGVGTTDEALCLRTNKINMPVLILGCVLEYEIPPIIKNNIAQTVGDIAFARAVNRRALKMKKLAKVHIKIDTGMGRIGIWHEDALELIEDIAMLENIEIEGIFSHFPSADEDELLTRKQIKDFSSLIDDLESRGIFIRYRHMANSAATIYYKDSHMNLVRPGLMIYGLNPKPSAKYDKIRLIPALSLKSRIVFLKDVPAGRKISYGGTYTTARNTRIATIPIGYGDGLSRHLSNRGSVLISGKKAPIIGRVCMDQIMADVGHIPDAKIGDEVVLIGRQKGEEIKVEDIASLCGTISYEVACWFDKRVPLVHKK